MSSRTRPFSIRTALFLSLSTLVTGATVDALTWAPDGSVGGSGTWDATSTAWLDGGIQVAYEPAANVEFSAPGGTVELQGALIAGEAVFASDDYLLIFDNASGSQLDLVRLDGRPQIGFKGVIDAGADNYPSLSVLQSVGLNFSPAGTRRLEADIIPILGGSPVVSVRGDAGRIEFAGNWYSDSGSIISWLQLEQGGHFVLTEEAEMYFIKEGFFTLQMWVTGDGSGTLELAEGFVADRTQAGLAQKGIGSIRMGAGTLISHHSQNLPLGYRPRADGSAQTNGHLVFENQNGSRWIVRGNDQVYPGAVWIFKSLELVTETDLMHVGVTEGSSNYTAQNGWSILKAATLTKSGPGTLTLAGEQSYATGAGITVQEGTLALQSDPSTGRSLSGSVTGAQLTLQVAEAARLEWQTDGAIQSLFMNGDLLLNGTLLLDNGGLAIFGAGSRTEVLLGESPTANRIQLAGPLFLEGALSVSALPAVPPVPGTEWIICEAGSITGTWILDDRTSLDLQLVQDATSLRLVVGPNASGMPGSVVLEDGFDAPGGPWDDLSTVPLWGSPLASGTAFEWINGVVRLNRSGDRATTNYTRYDNPNGIKTFTALDYQFLQPVAHSGSELTVDFRLRWPTVTDNSGEGGRFIVLLNHAYPEGGLDLTPQGSPGSKISDFSSDWWARPAYHVRLRNSTTRAGSSFLQYGGGIDADGEYEATAAYWLPGFVSGAGGVAPGAGEDFPENSWTRTREGMARDTFTTFRYRILPDRQELWRDDNDDGVLSGDELKATMPLPADSDAPLYQYFDTVEGIRLFWNGTDDGAGDPGQVELDWLAVVVQDNLTPLADAGPDLFAQQLVEGMAPVQLDAGGSADPEGEALLYSWFNDNVLLLTTRSPQVRVQLPVGEHVLDLLVIDAAGNAAVDSVNVTVTIGKARPLANAGPDQSVTAVNDWFGIVSVSGAASFSPTNSIVRYRWSTGIEDRTLSDGPLAQAELALAIGTHILKLTVWDEEGLFTGTTVRITVDPVDAGVAPEVIYRENFSRPAGGEMGPWAVGWNLMRFDGEPVASVKWDGNAHRSLSYNSSGNAPYQSKVNANPDGLEFDAVNSGGHMWMNQMPYLNASPGEWMLWTDELAIDQEQWQPTRITFYSQDGSPERVKVAPAVRIDGQWYIGWELRIETQYNYWRSYTIDLATTGWVLFEPSLVFSATDAAPVERLPAGVISAFGLYMLKDYAWYVNEIDNVAVWAVPAVGDNPYRDWVAESFPQSVLTQPQDASLFAPDGDADGNGWSNLWEYAMGRPPLDSADFAGPGRTFIDAGSVVIDLPHNPEATNLDYSALQSVDLIDWFPVDALHRNYQDEEIGQPRQQWRMPPPEPATPQLFYRVELRFTE